MLVRKNKTEKQSISDNFKSLCSTLIVGLGNPGYDWTRHNIGSDLLDLLIINKNKKKLLENLSLVFFNGFCSFVYTSPDLMNISGNKIVKTFEKLGCINLVVVTDDLDTKIGKIKTCFGVTSGGHNGVKSIIEHLGHNRFWKIKIGIGRPEHGDISEFVLEKFMKEERDQLINLTNELENSLCEVFKNFSV